ncbi:hypothetical protein AQ490_10760 [Wenjunlia vitaminophila]|uniref:CSLREA domain-containing protein n=1 Tax=Wenjunlia vitaminophila TaxID=76728 RepID=A0A0T6LK50_WENVI|nr:hypothetical protein [Wenjunlia vitaminophila]KRV46392.1 hypothetical protein AQ490_10760 [Wenjunlia vitaminophila]
MRTFLAHTARVLCIGAVAAAASLATPASAQTPVDCNETALRDAITAANNAGGGSLSLRPGCTYTLTTPLPDITGRLVIDANRSTITRDTTAPSFGILTVRGSLALEEATITNGDAPDFGGGIANYGNLTVTSSNIRDNHARFSGGIGGFTNTQTQILSSNITNNRADVNGGGMANDGVMRVISSRVNNNTAGSLGGGLANDGLLYVVQSNVNANQANRGGGLANVGNTSTVIESNINDNTAASAPGGVLNTSGSVFLLFSRVNGNTPTNCAGSPIPVPMCTG